MSRLALVVLVPGLFVCVLSAEEAVRPNSKCGGYTLYKDARGYLIYNELPVTFDDAKRRCAAEGGVLASPINDGIKAAMMEILVRNLNEKKKVFTGFSAKPHNGGIFSSIEGTRLSNVEHTWAPDEPNNEDGEENCIVLSRHGTMSDVNCGSRNPYLCFLSEDRVKHICGIKNGDYALENTTGSCYKLHKDELVYNDAAMVCEHEGGHLAIINGENEAQAVADLIKNSNLGVISVGFQFIKNSGKWMTVQGETIEEAGYAKWPSWASLNSAPNMAPGLLANDGLLRYDLPSATRPFICEKDPEIVVCD